MAATNPGAPTIQHPYLAGQTAAEVAAGAPAAAPAPPVRDMAGQIADMGAQLLMRKRWIAPLDADLRSYHQAIRDAERARAALVADIEAAALDRIQELADLAVTPGRWVLEREVRPPLANAGQIEAVCEWVPDAEPDTVPDVAQVPVDVALAVLDPQDAHRHLFDPFRDLAAEHDDEEARERARLRREAFCAQARTGMVQVEKGRARVAFKALLRAVNSIGAAEEEAARETAELQAAIDAGRARRERLLHIAAQEVA